MRVADCGGTRGSLEEACSVKSCGDRLIGMGGAQDGWN